MEFKNIMLNCIKGIPIDSVQPRTLTEIGFPVDAPEQPNLLHSSVWTSYFYKLYDTPYSIVGSVEKKYIRCLLQRRCKETAFNYVLSELTEYGVTADELVAGLSSGCVFTLTADEADALQDEFRYIIKKLLPRQLSDIYYSFDIKPNPAHSVFFELVVEMLGIQRYTDQAKNNYGQFISYPACGIRKRILSGEALQSIYQKTCATKKMITDVWHNLKLKDFDENVYVYHLRKIEASLFRLSRQYRYSFISSNNQVEYFEVKDDSGNVVLTVGYLSKEQFCHTYDYNKSIEYPPSCASESHIVIDFNELMNGCCSSSIIRKGILDKSAIEYHKEKRNAFFTYGRALDNCEYNRDALQTAKICGCFSCTSIFSVNDISEWDINDSAYCPHCGRTTVIADCQGYIITEDFLKNTKRYAEMLDDDDE